MADSIDTLEAARQAAGLSLTELWLRYFELGGMGEAVELDAILNGALIATDHERDVIAVAINERVFELGGDHPVPYTDD